MNIGLERYRYYHQALMENPLFDNVPRTSIEDLLRLTHTKVCNNRTCVLDTRDVSHTFFIVISGKLKVYVYDTKNDRQVTLTLLLPDDVFSVMSLFGGVKRRVYYETLEQTELLCVPVVEMKHWLRKNHEFSQALLRYMAFKIQNLENSVSDLVMDNISTRLAKLLYHNMDKNTGVVEYINDLSHDEIGALIGTTRSVVNRHINSLKDQGILEVKRKFMRVTSIDELRRNLE